MNRTKIIWGAVALVVIIGLGWILFRGSGEQQVSKLDSIDTVGGFYEQWLEAVKEPTVAEPSRKVLAKSPILSKTLSKRLVEAQKTPNAGIDPVLCQTVIPEDIATMRAFEEIDKAQVIVVSRDREITEQALVTLLRLNDGWYIDEIECLAGEFAPEREFSFEKEGFLLKGSTPPPFDPKNWHLVFEENGELGHVVPLFFDSESECTDLNDAKSPCQPDQLNEATKVFVQGQMTERGLSVKNLKFVK